MKRVMAVAVTAGVLMGSPLRGMKRAAGEEEVVVGTPVPGYPVGGDASGAGGC